MTLRAPAPYYGSKAKVADVIWRAFGEVVNYVEPFCGMASVLLARPQPFSGVETINDAHAFIPNLWRALREKPDEVAYWADQPVHEADPHAVHRWLLEQADAGFVERMMVDPEFFDTKIAGRWVWGASAWLGHGWCSSGERSKKKKPRLCGNSASVGRPRHGVGVHRTSLQIPVLRGGGGSGENRAKGVGVGYGNTINSLSLRTNIQGYFRELQERLRFVRVTCGDWTRVLTESVTTSHGTTGVLLDPPYGHLTGRDERLYAVDDLGVASRVCEWALTHGEDPRFRIAFCGFSGEHDIPESWREVGWTSAANSKNAKRERIWLSPHCDLEQQLSFATQLGYDERTR